MRELRLGRLLLGCALLGAISSSAFAGLDGPIFSLEAVSELGSAGFYVNEDQITNSGNDIYTWSLEAPVELHAENGALIATLTGAVVMYQSDPIVGMSFSLAAGASATHFVITSATLHFPTISIPQGQASAGVTVTDFNGNGANYAANLLGNTSHQAVYNGFPGTLFKSMLGGYGVSPGNSLTHSDSYGFVPVGTAVSDMTAQWDFTLSSFDLVGGTSRFEIQPVPEPATIAALGIGALALLRRRKR